MASIGNSTLPSGLDEVKAAYRRAVAAEDCAAMLAYAEQLMDMSPTIAIAHQIAASLPAGLPNRPAIGLKVAVLRSFTIEPAIPFLKALTRLYGIDLEVKLGEFNSYAQEIIDPDSWLYTFEPQIVILAVQTRDILPQLWLAAPELPDQDAATFVAENLARISSLLSRLRSQSSASVIVQNFEQPTYASAGVLDARRRFGQAELIRLVNRELSWEALKYEGIYVLDYDGLVSRHGRERWTDEKKWLTSRAPIAADGLVHFAREYLKFLIPLASRQSKVLIVDLDNTLWGGVVGEDGVDGIKIGDEYPGAAYLALQRAILDVAARGILLAICSKNNKRDAMEAFETRSEMLLRPTHFAAMRIDWNDKSENVRAIAAELNVGLDSIVFLDDNPVERQRVKLACPEVVVINLPRDSAGFAAALRNSPVFESLSVTAEDRARNSYYAGQRERQKLGSSVTSLEDFYRSLEMRSEIVEVTPATLERIAQLTQKTNQLNTTTRRYNENEVLALSRHPDWNVFGMRIIDKFGDNGIVGAVFLKRVGAAAELDTFLMSCRVIGRTVETAMLSHACELARSNGCMELRGWFLPTNKNLPAAKIYTDHGFTLVESADNGTLWQLDIARDPIAKPAWIA